MYHLVQYHLIHHYTILNRKFYKRKGTIRYNVVQMSETFVAQVSRGRITIDSKIRDFLGINDGDYVRITVEKATNGQKEPS
jgi:hypothetical protein